MEVNCFCRLQRSGITGEPTFVHTVNLPDYYTRSRYLRTVSRNPFTQIQVKAVK